MNTPQIQGHSRQLHYLDSLLKSESVPHAFIFTGPAGIGKRMVAEAFLSALFCTGEAKPCGQCPSCRQILAGTFPDLCRTSPNENGYLAVGDSDKPEHGSARWIIQKMGMKPVSGRSAAIIDGIDRTHGDEVQNALLKTVEEPGEGSCIILIASERSRVLPTILSRCIEIRFQPLKTELIRTIIKNETDSGDILDFAVSASGGSVENARALLDEKFRTELISVCGDLSRSVVSGSALSIPAQFLARPKSGVDSVEIMISVYHHLLRCLAKGAAPGSILYDDINIDDLSPLGTIIKMLLAVKKGRANNLNASLQLKSLSYHLNDPDLPEPPFALQF